MNQVYTHHQFACHCLMQIHIAPTLFSLPLVGSHTAAYLVPEDLEHVSRQS